MSITVTPSHPACTWTSSTATEWIELRSGGVHAGAGSFLIGAHPNGITGRTAAARVGTEEIWVDQIGDGCTFTVEPRVFPINPSDGGMSAFGDWIYASITIPPGCGWEAWTMTPSIVDQVQLPSSNPAGSGQIQIHLLENTTPLRRTATVHVGKPGYPSQNISITQCEAGGCAPPPPATSFAFPPANGLDPGGTRLFVHTDALGSVRMLTDDAAVEVARYDYQPFGQDWQTTGAQAAANKIRFAGGERETDVVFGGWQALDYFGARYYQSQTGRFTRPDDGFIDPFHPQSMNLYTYVLNNPLGLVDPSGHAGKCPPGVDFCTGVEVEDPWERSRDFFFNRMFAWLINAPASNVFAGFGDSTTFNATRFVRWGLDIDDVVDRCSDAYANGVKAELGLEISAMGASWALRAAAAGASRAAVRGAARRQVAELGLKGSHANPIHHINPLFGHPGGAPTVFPMGGLPAAVHSGWWNVTQLSASAHTAAHGWMRASEALATSVVNPYATAARIGVAVADRCQ